MFYIFGTYIELVMHFQNEALFFDIFIDTLFTTLILTPFPSLFFKFFLTFFSRLEHFDTFFNVISTLYVKKVLKCIEFCNILSFNILVSKMVSKKYKKQRPFWIMHRHAQIRISIFIIGIQECVHFISWKALRVACYLVIPPTYFFNMHCALKTITTYMNELW